MAPSSNRPDDLKSLLDLTTTSQALINQFLSSLTSDPPTTTSLPADPPNPLHVLRDSASLLKAQTTKLSLLLLNKPFTPSAITSVIREIAATCLPAMMSAVEICSAEVWGRILRGEVVSRVSSVMREMRGCLGEVEETVRGEMQAKGSAENKQPAGRRKSKDQLATTGVVWEACDRVVELEELDLGGVVIKRAEEYRDMIRDAIEELKEWAEDEEDEEDDFAGSDDDDDGSGDSVEDMFSAANKLPKDRPELKKQLEHAIGKLKKINILCTAFSKRRLKTITPAVARRKSHVVTIDELMDKLKQLPEMVDELANAFYELDSEQATEQMNGCVAESREAIKLVKNNWDGKEDEFTTWSSKWEEVVK